MQARVSVAAGRRLRQQMVQSAALREVLAHPAALAARRTAARTARQLAPKAADRFIADIKGTEPLLASVRAERRHGRRSGTLQLAATLSAAAVVGGLLVSAPGYAAPIGDQRAVSATLNDALPLGSVSDPHLYPRPQAMRTAGQPVGLPRTVTVVESPGADAPAVDALRQLLGSAGVAEVLHASGSQAPAAGSLVVYVGGPRGVAGTPAEKVLADLATAAGEPDPAALTPAGLPSGGYVLASGLLPVPGGTGSYGAVVLAGTDGTGTFYAVQSLRQLLAALPPGPGQETGKGFPGVTVRDWPSGAPVRGTAETFYGTPWTADQRLSLIDFLGRTKQNYFLYAPGGDPYRLSRWREAYPAKQLDELRRLTARARANHVTPAYAIDPGQSFCFSSGKDLDALTAKLEALRSAGFEAFQLQFLGVSYDEWHCSGDRKAYGSGPAAAAKAQAELVTRVRERLAAKGRPVQLSVQPTEYQKQGATPYRTTLAAALPGDVQVVWSGGSVIAEQISGGQITDTAGLFGRPLMTLDSYPVNDSTPDRLYLGGYAGRDPEVAKRSAVLLSAAMSQPVASRIPLATAADFGWQPDGYQAADSWRSALRSLADSDAELAALTALAGNSSSSPLAKEESGYLAPQLERFWTTLEPTSGVAPDLAKLHEAAAPAREAFGAMADARRVLATDPIAAEAGPWLDRLATYGRAGQAAVDMLLAQRGGDGTAAWQARVELRRLREQLDRTPVTVGAGVLDAFLERALKSADTWSGMTAGGATATTTLGTAQDHVPGLMTDGAADTFYWSAAPPQPGDAVGLDLGASRPLGTVTVLMGSWGDGPDAASAAEDYLHDGVLEYTTGSGGWQQLARVHDQKSVSVTAPAGVSAKAVRLRATGGQKTAVAVREFTVSAPGDTPAQVSAPPALPGSSAAAVLDGDPDTAYRAAAAPGAFDAPLVVDLGAARPLDRVTVLTDPTVRAAATAQVRGADGTWTPIGTVRPGYNELPVGGRAADAIRLVWAAGGEPPVVNQIIPWYADTPVARMTLADPTVDVVAGQAVPVQARAVLEAVRPDGLTGELKAEVPGVAKGLSVVPAGAVAVPRGGRVSAPVAVAAAADTPSGTYQVPLTFTVGGMTVRQVLQVHVVPPTGGPDLASTAVASSSADETPAFPASAVADGDPRTRWSSPAVDDAWVQLRLPKPVRLGSAVLHWQSAYASAYRVQASADGVTWTTVATVEDGRGGHETVRFDAPDTRFLRVQGVSRATKYGYSLFGVELYAVTAP
ncbi:beta-N-acetylglucosaminidase domain-containing protein [Kitasatospora camelliae]|uniref:Beta-N-acetylglucosaminidase domain-containing protein n=1 Tax=Kitasatospora camelliae TaxID=3156397 RepID=A0AAU8K2Y8_9ACTN